MQHWRAIFPALTLSALLLLSAVAWISDSVIPWWQTSGYATLWEQGTSSCHFALSFLPPHVTEPIYRTKRTENSWNLLNLEFTLSGIIQLLLVVSGIETNPGPSDPANSPCCIGVQHINRVKRVISEVQTNFRSKVEPDTLSKPAIEIYEAGNHCKDTHYF